jgi:hypothetical protein
MIKRQSLEYDYCFLLLTVYWDEYDMQAERVRYEESTAFARTCGAKDSSTLSTILEKTIFHYIVVEAMVVIKKTLYDALPSYTIPS